MTKYIYYRRFDCGNTVWRFLGNEAWIILSNNKKWSTSSCIPEMFTKDLGGISFTSLKKAIKHKFI